MIRIEKKIDKIAHLADIHIRNVQRHSEYLKVFKELYSNLETSLTDNSVIFVGGDIVHSKTDMSPELIKMVSDFLKSLSDIALTVVIPGNHDANLNNPTRLDALTPIIENIDNSRIVYIKDSQVISFDNCNFVHYSIFDTPSVWSSIDIPNADLNIGLFHGPLSSASTDIGYKVTDAFTDVSTFKGCHLVLAGDIHKQQIIQGTPGSPLAVYCGSLIQQNFGELPQNHGYILWDITDNLKPKCNAVDLVNERGYYTIIVENGQITQMPKLTKRPNLRVKFFDTGEDRIRDILHEIRSTTKLTDISVVKLNNGGKFSTINDALDIDGITSIDYQNVLITKYLKDISNISIDVIERVKDLNVEMNGLLPKTDLKNINWKPIRFEFSNMFSYGENNVLDFTKLSGINGLFASNATGKSSLFDALLFCLFDKCSRAYKASHILNTSKRKFRCKLQFELNGKTFYIEKIAKRHAKYDSVRVDINFSMDDNGKLINLNGESRRETNQIIQEYVGTYDDFILTSISLQNKNSIFIDIGQSDRKDTLLQFMGVNIFDDLYRLAIDALKKIETRLEEKGSIDYETKIRELNELIDELDSNKKELEENLSTMNQQIKDGYNEKVTLTKTLKPVDSSVNVSESTSSLQTKLIAAETLASELDSDISQLSLAIDQQSSELELLNDELSNIDQSEVLNLHSKYVEHSDSLKFLTKDIKSSEKQIAILNDTIDKNSKLRYDPDCEFCIENSKVIGDSTISTQEKLNKLQLLLSKKYSTKQELDEFIQENGTKAVDDYNALSSIRDKITSLEKLMKDNELSLTKKSNELVSANSSVDSIKQTINQFNSNKEAIEHNSEITKQLATIDHNIEEITDNVESVSKEIQTISSKLVLSKNELTRFESDVKAVKTLKVDQLVYSEYIKCVKRDGIPHSLVEELLPFIEFKVNEILDQIVDFNVILSVEGKNISGFIQYQSGKKWPLEMASGMEKFISGLSIRIALMNICNLPKPNFIIIDEGFGTLDSNNISSLYSLFDFLKSQFEFSVVISHVSSMRDMVDYLIEIKKDSKGFSSISY